MLGFNHTLAGCIIAVITPAPLVPFVAFASHFLLDMTPHFGRSKRIYPYTKSFIGLLVLDAILCTFCLFLAIALFPDKWFILAVGAFFATLPDFMWLLKGRVKQLDRFFAFASKIQWGEHPYGWIFDASYGYIFMIVLFRIAA
jgi:hypothetical protein